MTIEPPQHWDDVYGKCDLPQRMPTPRFDKPSHLRGSTLDADDEAEEIVEVGLILVTTWIDLQIVRQRRRKVSAIESAPLQADRALELHSSAEIVDDPVSRSIEAKLYSLPRPDDSNVRTTTVHNGFYC